MGLTAVFFDRDGTLTYNDPQWERLRAEKLREWSGRAFDDSEAYFMTVFRRVMAGGFPFAPYRTVGEELAFFRQWYRYVFEDMGIRDRVEERVDYLTEHLWYWKKQLYPETREVLEAFKGRGIAMGVISDSPPSLEQTLIACGIGGYFSSFTASSLVGAGKPDPRIFRAALEAQGVRARDCLYVDDCKREADGARDYGFTAFWLDREGAGQGAWTIRDLRELAAFAETL